MSSSQALPPLPTALAVHSAYYSIISDATAILKSIPEWKSLRLNPSLTQHLGSVVLNLFKSATPDQFESIIVTILQQAFILTPDEVALIKTQLQFILDNKLLVTVSTSAKVKAFLFGSKKA